MRRVKHLIAALLLSVSAIVQASPDGAFSACSQFFPRGTSPRVPNVADLGGRPLCFSSFAVLHSAKTKTPIFVAEKLNRATILDADGEERTNRFYAEARLPYAERAQLTDYEGSGYDRGHMAPSGDMASPEAMAQSFSLANMVPQVPNNNRGVWFSSVERAVRKYVKRAEGDVYVITGPVFQGPVKTIGASHVWVPTYLFKLVYDSSTNRAWVYWVPNQKNVRLGKPLSYEELVRRTGVDFLPGVHPTSVIN